MNISGLQCGNKQLMWRMTIHYKLGNNRCLIGLIQFYTTIIHNNPTEREALCSEVLLVKLMLQSYCVCKQQEGSFPCSLELVSISPNEICTSSQTCCHLVQTDEKNCFPLPDVKERVNYFRERTEEMLPRKQFDKRGRSPQ